MGSIRYDGVTYEIADNVAATLRPVLRDAIAHDAAFSVTVFDPAEGTTTGLFLGPGVPIAISDAGGTADRDCAVRWTATARAGGWLDICCIDLACDCVLREGSPHV